MQPSWSPWSKIVNAPPLPRLLRSRVRTPRPNEWNVEIVSWPATLASPSAFAIRSRISAAALLVKVSATIPLAGMPRSRRRTTRCVMTRVFPEPAAARTSIGPVKCSTASLCAGFSVG